MRKPKDPKKRQKVVRGRQPPVMQQSINRANAAALKATETPPTHSGETSVPERAMGTGLPVRNSLRLLAQRVRMGKCANEELEKGLLFCKSVMADKRASRRDKIRVTETLRQITADIDKAAARLAASEDRAIERELRTQYPGVATPDAVPEQPNTVCFNFFSAPMPKLPGGG